MAFDLSSIQKTKNMTPPRIVIHGAEKVGKSTWAASAENPIFIRTEDGLNGINAQAFPLITHFYDVLHQLDFILAGEHQFKTLVIDSGDWLERHIHTFVCDQDNAETIAKAGGGYGNGYISAVNHWRTILNYLDRINRERSMVIIIINHSRVVQFNDPQTEPYDIYKMKLHSPKSGNGACELLQEWADVIGFASQNVFISKQDVASATGPKKDEKGAQVARGGVAGAMNKLHLVGRPAYMAGNRYNLPETIDLDWQKFRACLDAATQPAQPTQQPQGA